MDGTERKELHSSEILHIFGLTLLGEHLYWTDMQKRTLDRINKNTGKQKLFYCFKLENHKSTAVNLLLHTFLSRESQPVQYG